jgi:cytidylate kinase
MSTTQPHDEHSAHDVVERLAEKSIQWAEIRQEVAAALRSGHSDEAEFHMRDFITVNGDYAAGNHELGRRLGERLGWPVADRELIDMVAEHYHLPGAALELLDEEQSNWVRDVLGDFMPTQVVNRDSYVSHLGKVIKLLAMRGRVVLVGHAAQYFLPRRGGLRIRVVAPLDLRLERVMADEGVGADEARKIVAGHDRKHAQFVEHYFGQDVSDENGYDLVINTRLLGPAEVLDVAYAAAAARGLVSTSQRRVAGE